MVVGLDRLVGRVVVFGEEKFSVVLAIFNEKTSSIQLVCSNMKDKTIKRLDLDSVKVTSP